MKLIRFQANTLAEVMVAAVILMISFGMMLNMSDHLIFKMIPLTKEYKNVVRVRDSLLIEISNEPALLSEISLDYSWGAVDVEIVDHNPPYIWTQISCVMANGFVFSTNYLLTDEKIYSNDNYRSVDSNDIE